MRTFVMGDIHGAYLALLQCLERSGFNKEEDVLIQLGDVVDGWGQVYECVEELLTIKNLIAIKGNHDDEFWQWITYGLHRWNWQQGAEATARSYIAHAERKDIIFENKFSGNKTNLTTWDIPRTHQRFFDKQPLYYIDTERNICFVHGGFNRHIDFKGQSPHVYYWDRDLWMTALSFKDSKYKFKMHTPFTEVFIGHTTTNNWTKTITVCEKEDADSINMQGDINFYKKVIPIEEPMHAANIWNLDTGAGFSGKLTMMDIDTKECYQSDNVKLLYPNERGR